MQSTVPWPLVGNLDPAGLVETRLQVHHAVQLVVSLGISFLPAQPDDSHTSLEWLPGLALAGHTIDVATPFRGSLRFDPLMLLLLNDGGDVLDEYPLDGRTVPQCSRWLVEAVRSMGAEAERLTDRRHYTIPDHPVARGAAFRPDQAAARELGRYYHGANLALTDIAGSRRDASQVRCWPHHFDLATLMTLAPGHTVGAGFSPGDESYPEPYYYVSPNPYPRGTLSPLRLGHWHTIGWTGAVLPASQLSRVGAAAQRENIQDFFAESVAACEALA
jgi:hypothetical protein